MKKNERFDWILSELPVLQQNGVITEEARESLEAYYSGLAGARKNSGNILSAIFGVFGSLLVLGGVLLFFSYNWDMLPKAVRVSISFVPLLAGLILGVWTICRDKKGIWGEISALTTGAGTACVIALISQIYHVNGSVQDYLLLVLSLTIPLVWIFHASILSIVLGIGVLFFIADGHSTHPYLWSGAAMIAALIPPALFALIREPLSWRSAAYRLSCVFLAIAFLSLGVTHIFYIAMIAAFLLACGFATESSGVLFLKNPFLVAGYPFLTVLMLIMTFEENFHFHHEAMSSLFLAGALLVVYAGCALMVYYKRKYGPEILTVMLMPFVTLMQYSKTFSNVFLLLSGGVMTVFGFRRKSLLEINAGMLQILLVAVCRFLDSRMPILARSFGFIVIGLVILITNLVLIRIFRKKESAK